MIVRDYLARQDVPFEVLQHPPSANAQQLAQQVSTAERQVAKTVLLRADRGFVFVCALVPADCDVDLEKASKALGGSRLEIASDDDLAEHCPDCQRGALPPFGSKYDMKTIVDRSLAEEDEIVFESNTHEEAIRMRFDDFKQLEEPLVVPIAKPCG
jgi:Ala-tRNA(Pro) deacylase